jgi:hypothetical protein
MFDTLGDGGEEPVTPALTDITDAAPLLALDPHTVSASGLVEGIEALLDAQNLIAAALCRWTQAADVTGATVDECGRTTRGFLVEELRRSPHEARRILTVARGLPGRPNVGDAFAAGRINQDHAQVILNCLRTLPEAWKDDGEEILLEAALSMDPVSLAKVAQGLMVASGAEESREAAAQRRYESRWARITTTFDGMIHLEGMFDPDTGRIIKTALDAVLSRPHRHDQPTGESTTDGDQTDCSPGSGSGSGPGFGICDADPRTPAQRLADAIGDLAQIAHTTGVLPDHGGDRPQVIVTIDYDTLRNQLADRLAGGTLLGAFDPHTISPHTARRLACDAEIIPAVLGSDSTTLDLGRTQRSWTTSQRRAAKLRDHGCVFPRCQAGLERCHLHHLWHWADGGPTTVENSAHLCTFHHWLVHHKNWAIWRDTITHTICVKRT